MEDRKNKKTEQQIEDENILWGFFTECATNTKFISWWKSVYPTIAHLRESKKKNLCNYSIITFALYELSSGQTAKKVAIGSVAEWLDEKTKIDFWFHLRNICPAGYEKLLPHEEEAVFMGIGIECIDKTFVWNFYIGTKDCRIYAVKCWGGKLLEFKHYKYDKSHDTMLVKGKVDRVQVNVELTDDKAKKVLDWLKQAGYINKIYPSAVALLEHLSLDTISASPKRGVALYFE